MEQSIKLNTPGKKDGIARAWIDGKLVFEKTDYLWRNTRKLRVYRHWVDYYLRGKQPAYHDHHVYLDNLVITTDKRVGMYTPFGIRADGGQEVMGQASAPIRKTELQYRVRRL